MRELENSAAAREGTSLLGLSVLVCDSPPALELMPPCLPGSPGKVTEASPPQLNTDLGCCQLPSPLSPVLLPASSIPARLWHQCPFSLEGHEMQINCGENGRA